MPENKPPTMRIAIVSASLALRAGLRALLTGSTGIPNSDSLSISGSDLDIVSEASTVNELIQADLAFDVLILDDDSPSSLEELAALPEGETGVILFGENLQAAPRLAALPLRGWGILPTDSTAAEIQTALQAVFHGLVVGPQALLGLSPARLTTMKEADSLEPVESLTPREVEVLQLLAHGLANKQIAQQLQISEHTVKFHISSIFAKLGAANRTEAVRSGVQRGLISL